MKPYIAILIDSFWEAVGSKVLWALLVCWTLLLLGLAPFGYITERSYELSSLDLRNRVGLAQKLEKGMNKQGSLAQQAVAAKLDDSFRKKLTESSKAANADDRFRMESRALTRQLNTILKAPDLYSDENFPTAKGRKRLEPILEKPAADRTELEIQELNRELLQIAFSADLNTPRSEQLWIGYGGLKLGDPLPITRRQANTFVEQFALQLIIKLGLSIVTVFVGVIVTSPMIPETFRSGSLHLLLSKPISRPLLYLSKFLGGTLFVFANITYFLIGLYFLVGLRLDIWNAGLLWCIPVILFVFVIFYSISALLGLIWNNPIICVVGCLVFWLFCTVLGVIRGIVYPHTEIVPQIVRFVQINDQTMAITQGGTINAWNEKFAVWQPALELRPNLEGGRILGPLFDKTHERIMLRADSRDVFGGFNTRARNFVVINLADATAKESSEPKAKDTESSPSIPEEEIKTIEDARRKSYWAGENGPEPPMLMLDLLSMQQFDIAVTRNGIFRIDWNTIDAMQKGKSAGGVFDFLRSAVTRLQPFDDITPPDYTFSDVVSVTASRDLDLLVIYNGATLDVLKYDTDSKKFAVASSQKLEGDGKEPGDVAISEKSIALARRGKGIALFPLQLGEATFTVEMPVENDVRQLQAIPQSNRYSVLTQAGSWLAIDGDTGKKSAISTPWQELITGVTWIDGKHAWLGIKPDRAVLWNQESGKVDKELTPTMSRVDFIYRWIINPLYKLNPKPAALDDVMSYLLSGKKQESTQLIQTDLEGPSRQLDIWQPIYSNLAFVAVMLGIGCIWVVRKQY